MLPAWATLEVRNSQAAAVRRLIPSYLWGVAVAQLRSGIAAGAGGLALKTNAPPPLAKRLWGASQPQPAMRRLLGVWASVALALLAQTAAAASRHSYKQGQEVSIWANKGEPPHRGLPGSEGCAQEAIWVMAGGGGLLHPHCCWSFRAASLTHVLSAPPATLPDGAVGPFANPT